MSAAQPLLQAEGLALVLGGRRVVDGVNLALHASQTVAIVGPNGAGKSSLLSLLAGLRPPAAGTVRLMDRPLADWPARQRAQRLAWLAQQGESTGELAARDVVMLGRLPQLGLLASPGPADHAAVDAAMAETDCADLAARRLSALSGGERQRVLLARALAVGAPLLLLDEPTTHLDPTHQLALMRSLLARARAGASVAAVLHDLNLALLADRLLVMERGRLVAAGSPDEPAVQQALVAVFRHAFHILPHPQPEPPDAASGASCRWLVVPRLGAAPPSPPLPPPH